jgi:hypothetical protein
MKRFWNNLHQVRSKSKDWRSNVFVSKKTPFLVGSMLFIFLFFCVVLLCVITFWVLCCDTSYDFRIKTMFDSSFPSVVCRMAHVLFTLCGCYSGIQHILCCGFFSFFVVLCTIYCQFLWIVHWWFPFRYSLTFI